VARGRLLSFPRRSGASRRKVSWAIGPGGQIFGLSASSNNLFPTGSVALVDDLTLVRTRGELIVSLDSIAAVDTGYQWAFGMCNVSENAFGVGVTAVPHPIADLAWDGWFYHVQGHLTPSASTTPDQSAPAWVSKTIVDSKAMRKTHLSDVLIGVFSVTEIGDASISAQLATRVLDKLP